MLFRDRDSKSRGRFARIGSDCDDTAPSPFIVGGDDDDDNDDDDDDDENEDDDDEGVDGAEADGRHGHYTKQWQRRRQRHRAGGGPGFVPLSSAADSDDDNGNGGSDDDQHPDRDGASDGGTGVMKRNPFVEPDLGDEGTEGTEGTPSKSAKFDAASAQGGLLGKVLASETFEQLRVVVTLGLPNNVEKFSSFLPPFVMLMFMGALGPDEIAGAGMGFMFGNVSGAAYPLPDLPLVALSLSRSFSLRLRPSLSLSLSLLCLCADGRTDGPTDLTD
jgi:hypothetical protein